MASGSQVRVLLVDDHPMMREGLRSLFDREEDIEIVGEADSAAGAVHAARELRPDLVLLDVMMPGTNGVDAARRMREQIPQTRIIALSTICARTFVTEMLRAGAYGYVLKENASSELAEAVRVVNAGDVYLCAGARDLVHD